MRYKIGDSVKYDSGEFWFYGTVTAVMENSICPCYRLSIERIEKMDCKFSITQFEFELEPESEIEIDKKQRKWDTIEVENLTNIQSVQIGEPIPEIVETPKTPIIEAPKRRRDEKWDNKLEMYINGMKTNEIHSWASQNRKQYQAGKLDEYRILKLKQINFPFKLRKKRSKKTLFEKTISSDSWDYKYEQWKKGERASLLHWRQRSVKQYVEGKLSKDRINKLKEIGILK